MLAVFALYWLAGCERFTASGTAQVAPTTEEIRGMFERPVRASDNGKPEFKIVQFSTEPCTLEPSAPAAKPEFVCAVTFLEVNIKGKPMREARHDPFLFKKVDGKWDRLYYHAGTKIQLAKGRAETEIWENHSLGRLALYTLASVLLAIYLCRRLPKFPWNNPRLHERATPELGRPIQTGNATADGIGRGVAEGMNNITPAGAVSMFGLLLGIVGFFLGGMLVPGYLIDLAYIGWIERTLVYVCAFAWAITFMRMLRSVPTLLGVGALGYGIFWLATSAFVTPDNGIKWGEVAKPKVTEVKHDDEVREPRNARQKRLYGQALFGR